LFERLRRTLPTEPDLTWLDASDETIALPSEPTTAQRTRPSFRLEVNAPLVLGGVIVLGLFVVVLFGPLFAPANPYLAGQQSTMVVDGSLATPPFPPMPGIPLGTDQWGRDILSMLLYGTRNTLVACLFIAMARVILGSALGMLAGWNENRIVDRAVMGLIEATTALPALLTGMILIFALGIQRGITVFIFALCFVGWAEIAQYIRSEFMVVRRKPFIEGARVVGLTGVGIAVRHILPNVLPALVIIAVLEMGAVLMILGELGFIGVFIGGGGWVQIADTTVLNIPDIPEWGSMMAGARQYARSRTWMVLYPAVAFFLAVLGFNLLGEGLRRIVQRRGVNTAFILSKRMAAAIAVITLATAYIITHVGPAPSYASLAQQFDASGAMSHLSVLSSPDMQGRQPGTAGAQRAASYIAEQFAANGLETILHGMDYRLPWATAIVSPLTQPVLAMQDAAGVGVHSFGYRAEFGVDIRGHGGAGDVQAPLALITFYQQEPDPLGFAGMDLRGRVALYLADSAPPGFAVEALLRGAVGIILIDEDITPRLQLADPEADYLRPVVLPIFRLHPSAADTLLAPDGWTVADIQGALQVPNADPAPWQVLELSHTVHMKLELSPIREVVTDNIIGVFRGADAVLNDELVIVASHYDGPGRQPDGTMLNSVNDGATGVAVMLDILRLWTTTGFQPRRTVFFVAWSGGEWEHSGAHEYIAAQAPYSILETAAVVNLGPLGQGSEELYLQGDRELRELFRRTAEGNSLPATEGRVTAHAYQQAFPEASIAVGWRDAGLEPHEDTFDRINADQIQAAGQAINLALITLGREYEY